MAAVTPSTKQALIKSFLQNVSPFEKLPTEVRYDRQLRLWGDHGQKALEHANVALLGASAVGVEILKSLVLPGIGSFTIFDGCQASEEDLSCNYFLQPDSLGKSRAEQTMITLMEMNSDVKGAFRDQSAEDLLKEGLNSLDSFSIVIVANLTEKLTAQIGDYLWQSNTPLVVVESVGLIGYLRIVVREHEMVETHPDNAFDDLRLDRPFTALTEHVDTVDLSALTHQQHSHTPYLILLCKALDIWRQQQPGRVFPSDYAQRKQIRTILLSMRMPDHKGRLDEENFEEAVNSLNRCLRLTKVPPNVLGLFADPRSTELSSKSSRFWWVIAALKAFVSENGCLPLRGSLPDMTANSTEYIKLQNIYKGQAESDCARVANLLAKILAEHKLPSDYIAMDYIQLCCKHAQQMHCITGTSLRQELERPNVALINQALEQDDVAMQWYIQLRARERFCTEKGRYPGTNGIPVQLDSLDLNNRFKHLVNAWGIHQQNILKIDTNITDEICRYGASQVHGVSAIVGGIAAHECIKLITHQYQPIDNTFIYNASLCQASTWQM